jgi:PAS domain S-box-containing protein
MTHIQDISERKAVHDALRASEEKFRNAFLFSPDAVGFSRLRDGRYAFVNSGFTRVLGYPLVEVLGKTSLELNLWVNPDDRTSLVAELTAEGRVENFEARLRRKEGAIRVVLMSATLVELDGEPHVLNIVRDVTERRKREAEAEAVKAERIRLLEEEDRSRRALLSLVEDQARTEDALRQSEARYRQLNAELEERVKERTSQLEASNKELEAFSYSVSHDLRAPLRAIEGFSAMVVESFGNEVDPEAQRLLAVVRANARKMSRLIDDLLAFSRLGRSEMRHGRVKMEELVRRSFEEIVLDAGARARIDFRVGGLPDVEGDAALLKQVWVNLLSNAVKFSAGKERPVVEVEGTVEGGLATFHVRDNGAGFDMAFVGKLFGVFQRLHAVNEFEGTGVGLALVQRIVSRHGGRVRAEGAVGRGATISFELPAPPREARNG